jgi:uncharacterized coiled-coil protein SlyX
MIEIEVDIRKRYSLYDSKEKIAVEFVVNVLKQHENELDRLIAQLELIVNKVNDLTDKLQQFM